MRIPSGPFESVKAVYWREEGEKCPKSISWVQPFEYGFEIHGNVHEVFDHIESRPKRKILSNGSNYFQPDLPAERENAFWNLLGSPQQVLENCNASEKTFVISLTIVFGSSFNSVTDFSPILKNMIDLQSISTFYLIFKNQLGSHNSQSSILKIPLREKQQIKPITGQSLPLGPTNDHHRFFIMELSYLWTF